MIEEKNINEMSIEELLNIPAIKWNEEISGFDSLVILPTNKIHDSGYRCMYFIACKGDRPVCKIGGGSDVIHINGIGGYGLDFLSRKHYPLKVDPIGWSLDSLPKSGLLRLFWHGQLKAGRSLSSFEIFAITEKNSSNN